MSAIKNFLKNLKLHESTISTVLGFLVIVVVGLLVVNYFRNLDENQAFPSGTQTEEANRPDSYKVAEGDSLWSISEKVYGSGYNWVDIRDANNITNPNDISEGQELIIPDVEVRSLTGNLAEANSTETPKATVTPAPTLTVSPTAKPTLAPIAEVKPAETSQPEAVIGETATSIAAGGSYTVVKGDNLWDIAVRAYGDGYRWSDIARANKLVNPSVIHAGNVLIIPS